MNMQRTGFHNLNVGAKNHCNPHFLYPYVKFAGRKLLYYKWVTDSFRMNVPPIFQKRFNYL